MIKRLLIFLLFPLVIFAQDLNERPSIKNELIERGRQAYFSKDLNKLQKITTQVDSLYNLEGDSILFAKYYHFKALQHKLTYKNDSAFYFYHESKNISKLINDSLAVGRRLLSLAVLQRNAKDFLGSEISSIEALQYLEPIKSYKYIEVVYNNLGVVAEELDKKEEASIYYNKALEINKNNKNDREYLFTINNLGFLYQNQSKHNKAKEYFLKGLKFDSIEQNHPHQYSLLLENLIFSELQLGMKDQVINRYNKVLEIKKRENNLQGVSTTLLNIANFYIDINKNQNAKLYGLEALKYAKQTHNNKRWLDALQLLSVLSSGNESKAYLEEYITLNDSLFQQERQLKNQFAKIRYETDKKEKENTFLKSENEKRLAEVEKQRQQKIIGWLVAILSVLILLSSISFFSFRRKRLLYQAQLQKIQARENERRQIAKSLHDEVAGDLRLLHQKLAQSQLLPEAQKLEEVKENVRNLSHQLSSVSFEKVNFVDQIINLISDYFEPGFIIRVHGLKEINWHNVNQSIKRVLYLSIRESIQNCQKYAEASRIDINFKVHKKAVHLDIQDNGKGFNTNNSKKGIGLQNMDERVGELNGKLAISSELEKGTQIAIQVPLNA
ncbi:tetratricopeptide repeat-containing sensor histidine kinase [Tenacibaculum agarivorans]|uniref:tetratricopeptide repeat-containing sensor histidine kinase n=1 Tax=Tenacibaculum agarivorans TaxID=1908389 RepID=UPI00094B7ECF|nr:tetratricopeptide repeat-containing sensor histidine kinase [Tenacibaculum agarivorans]